MKSEEAVEKMPIKHPFRSPLWIAIVAALVLFALGGQSFAQTGTFTATLSGSVTDSSGAVVRGAKVTLTSPDRGITRTFTTDEAGLYTFTLLPPGTYALQVAAEKFGPYKQTGITLAAGQTAQQHVSLKLGAVTESVEVTADAPLLNTENANISADISEKQITELPLNIRNAVGFALLNSSVSNSNLFQTVGSNGNSGTADQDVSFLNFGGTFFGTASYLLDGTWNNRMDWNGVVYVPMLDAIQEMKVQTNAFTSQYGWSSGNVVNMVTKSGTNGLHGTGYEFYRNSAMDAMGYFTSKKTDFNRNVYGGTIGGPIRKDKTFFFFGFEGNRSSQPATSTAWVPTDLMKSGDFSAQLGTTQVGTDALGRPIMAGAIYNPFTTRAITAGQVDPVTGLTATSSGYIRDPFPGNKIPANLLNSVGKKLVTYYPSPNSTNPGFNYTSSGAAPFTSDEFTAKVDHRFNDNNFINYRFSHKNEQKTNVAAWYGADDAGGPGVVSPNNRWSTDLQFTHIFSPTFTGNANIGAVRHIEQSHVQSFGFKSSSLGLPSWIDSVTPLFPCVGVGNNMTGLGPGGGPGGGQGCGLDEYKVPLTNLTMALDFTKVKGSHNLSFGVADILNQLNGGHVYNTSLNFSSTQTAGPDPSQTTPGTGQSIASMLLGYGANGSAGVNMWPAVHKHYIGAYLQDDWKVNTKLTLNLGLRYEIQTAPEDSHNRQVYFDPTLVNPISQGLGGLTVYGAQVYNTSGNRGIYNTAYHNFAPRVGLAYRFTDKLVARAGFGLFYVPNYPGNPPTDGYSQSTPWVTSDSTGYTPLNLLSNAFPNGMIQPAGSANGAMQDVGYGANVALHDRKSPYVDQWMAGLEYSLPNGDLLDVTYVGNRGYNMLSTNYDINAVPTAFQATLGQPVAGNTIAPINQQVPNPFYGIIKSSGCGLADKTVARGQLLRPYPEFCSLNDTGAPVGSSWYNALQASYTHRWKSGLSALVSYTYSKFLSNVNGSSGWAYVGSWASERDFNNLGAEKSVDGSDQPHSLVANFVYELPIGRNKKLGNGMGRAANAIVGGWQVSGVATFKSGFPLSVTCPQATNNFQTATVERCNLVGNPVPQNQSINNWINAAAFQNPTQGVYGNSPRYLGNLRGPHFNNWDMAVQKYWNFTETKKLQFRLETFNTFNHTNFYQPDVNWGDGPGSFGVIKNAYLPRDVQLAVKFIF